MIEVFLTRQGASELSLMPEEVCSTRNQLDDEADEDFIFIPEYLHVHASNARIDGRMKRFRLCEHTLFMIARCANGDHFWSKQQSITEKTIQFPALKEKDSKPSMMNTCTRTYMQWKQTTIGPDWRQAMI